jgi:hypothetical protein
MTGGDYTDLKVPALSFFKPDGLDSFTDTTLEQFQQTITQEVIKGLLSNGLGSLAQNVKIWSRAGYDGPPKHGDIPTQRVRWEREKKIQRLFYVDKVEPLCHKGRPKLS